MIKNKNNKVKKKMNGKNLKKDQEHKNIINSFNNWKIKTKNKNQTKKIIKNNNSTKISKHKFNIHSLKLEIKF